LALVVWLYARQLTTPIESVGFVAGVVGVWLAARENAWTYPVGLINVAIYAQLFYTQRLYADATLNLIYFVLLCLGWYWWTRKHHRKPVLNVSHAPAIVLAKLLLAAGFAAPIVYWGLSQTNDPAPVLDGSLTILSLCAQFLQDRKFIENWAVWIVANAIYIPLFWSRQYYASSILFAIFLVLAIRGWINWSRELRNPATR
jgi:nicotinamide mononucleotide transporter